MDALFAILLEDIGLYEMSARLCSIAATEGVGGRFSGSADVSCATPFSGPLCWGLRWESSVVLERENPVTHLLYVQCSLVL